MQENKLISVEGLEIKFFLRKSTVEAVNGISFDINKGERVGLVGETGAGKTTTALAIMGLVPNPPGKVTAGTIKLDGENLLEKSKKDIFRLIC